MKLLEDRILKDGRILEGGKVLKVDAFVNHQLDVPFLDRLGEAHITKILTIEASGIGIACLTARHFGVPVVFAKKSKSSNIGSELYAASVDSFTHGNRNTVVVSAEYLKAGDRILIIDDFLATGSALMGLLSLCDQAGAQV